MDPIPWQVQCCALWGLLCSLFPTAPSAAQNALKIQEVQVVSTSGSVAARTVDGTTLPIKASNIPGGESSIWAKQGPGSTLATGVASSAFVSVPAIGAFIMGPNTQALLPKDEEKGHSLELLKGQLFFDISAEEVKKRGTATFRLKTPAAVLAVKGTKFFASSTLGIDTAGVHQGSVDVQETKSQQFVSLNSGKAVSIKPGEIGKERTLTPDEKAYLKNYDLMLGKIGNSLGMRFVAVPGTKVFMCIHETRRRDYSAFAAESPNVNSEWQNPIRDGVAVGENGDYPVVMVNWDDANAFCAWLSKKEGRTYRLPTDREWSAAIGIAQLESYDVNTTPFQLSMKLLDLFPWGKQWPPPNEFGNYADAPHKAAFPTRSVIEGFYDGFAVTAPVMSFKPNKIGLYDLAGNVWEHCEDWYDEKKTHHVIRGGGYSDASRTVLQSSMRSRPGAASGRGDHIGFRCALVIDPPSLKTP